MKGKIQKSNVQEIYELTAVQKGQLYHYLKEPGENLYQVQIAFTVQGDLQVDVLQHALKLVQQRHEVLRSVFNWDKAEKSLQIILRECPVDFRFKDITHIPEPNSYLQDLLSVDQNERFDLTELPLRVMVVKTGLLEYILAFSHHHILYDGWSSAIIIKELFQYYQQLCAGNLSQAENSIQYKAVLKSYNRQYGSPATEKYWKEYLSGFEICGFSFDKTMDQPGAIKKRSFSIPVAELETAAAKYKVTKAAIVYAAYGILMQKYLNVEDIVFGTVVSGRDASVRGIEEVAGNFINTIPLRISGIGELNIAGVISKVNNDLLARSANNNISYADIKGLLGLQPGEHLFESVIVVENYPVDYSRINNNNGLQVSLHSVYENTGLPLLITVFFNDQLTIELAFRTDFMHDEDAAIMGKRIMSIIQAISCNADRPVSAISLLYEVEKQQLLYAFNNTDASYPAGETVMSLFEQQVAKNPGNIALRCGQDIITYKELNERADQIAWCLRHFYQVRPGDVVGLMLERELYLIPAIFGILKAGCAYLPVDPNFPVARIKMIINDAGVNVMVTRAKYITDFIIADLRIADPEDMVRRAETEPDRESPAAVDSKSVAYVIYTSGSTGKPKGVMIEHHSIVNRLLWMQQQYPLGEQDVLIQKTPLIFDVSVWELFWWSLTGASLCVPPPSVEKDPEKLVETIQQYRVSTIHFVPSMLQVFLSYTAENFKCTPLKSLRFVFASGEALRPGHANEFSKTIYASTGARLINLYGPTEATVDVSAYECPLEKAITKVPIGKPVHNTQLYVLDKWMQPVPCGVPGELYIGGIQLARGYLNNINLTAEKFVANPYCAGGKIYRTGDLVKWLPDGNIEYIDRIDNQVKVRGFRIELGEIENVLGGIDEVQSCVVIANGHGANKYLVAYYIAAIANGENTLRNHLHTRLPAYMVPDYFVQISKLPLTVNGKLDRKALPDPVMQEALPFETVSDAMEEKLAQIWADILITEKARIPVTKSFFHLGGNSLKVILLVNRIYKEFNVKIPINEIFIHADIRSLKQHIQKTEKKEFVALEKTGPKEYYKTSSAQKRLYFLYETDRSSNAYVAGLTVLLEGKVNAQRMHHVFEQLVARHEVFRTSFVLVEGEVLQQIHAQVDFEMERLQSNEDDLPEAVKNFTRPFDLAKAPLVRAGLIRITDDKHLLIVDTHHIIGDAKSQEILVKEFKTLYNVGMLPELPLQYKDYADWQQSENRQKEIRQMESFWLNEFSEEIRPLDLPADHKRPLIKNYNGSSFAFSGTIEEFNNIQRLAEKEGCTVFMIILAAFNILLGKLSGEEDIVTGVSVSGRSQTELDQMIGLFINTLPIRNYPQGNLTFRQFLLAVKDKTLACFRHQDFAYEELIDKLKIERNTGRNPLFDVMLVFEQPSEIDLEIPGLKVLLYRREHTISKFDCSLSAYEKGKQLFFEFEYSTSLFNRSTIERFADYFRNIIAAIAADSDTPISDIEMVSGNERQEFIYNYNDTATVVAEETVIGLFDRQVNKTPGQLAIRYGDITIDYEELNSRSNKIAGWLQSQGVQPGDRIGMLVNRDEQLVPLIWGILKCGAAYVPIDPRYPADRINSITEDAGLKLLVHENDTAGMLKSDHPYRHVDVGSKDIAYIIYTSGSTGRPKGVMIEHGSLVNYIRWASEYYVQENDNAVFALFTSISFDLTVTSIFTPLVAGHSIIVYGEEEKENLPVKVFTDDIATVIKLTPTHLRILKESEAGLSASRRHKKLIVGGEDLEISLAKWIYETSKGGTTIYNEYGPTEATVGCMIYEFSEKDEEASVPIGNPISNMRVYLLDKWLKPVAAGVEGELYLSGIGLAKGYLFNEALSAERFIPDPYFPGARMYKTGDVAVRTTAGKVLFRGRSDEQVKIRGYRIEPAEIANELSKIPGIREAVVTVRSASTEKYLAAYYTSDQVIPGEAIKEQLIRKLPDYMVPAHYLQLQSIPVTRNGKLDKKALPDPVIKATAQYIKPVNETQKQLVTIWSNVLSVDEKEIGINANFYDVGGNSLKLIRMTSMVNKHFNTKISLAKMFELADVSAIAGYLNNNQQPRTVEADLEEGLMQMNDAVSIINSR